MRTGEKTQRNKRRLKLAIRITVASILAVFVLIGVLYYNSGASIFLYSVTGFVEHSFRSEQRVIQIRDADGWNDFTVCGVRLQEPVFEQDHYAAYVRMLGDAAELNANTVRVDDVMEPDFYRALQEFNKDRDDPLYLMQGVWLDQGDEYKLNKRLDGIVAPLKSKARLAIDAVHGHRHNLGYRYDVSKYTMSYLIGEMWDPQYVLDADRVYQSDAGQFEGKYISVWDTSSALETQLGNVLDDMFTYETAKYNMQSLIGLQNWHRTDALPKSGWNITEGNVFASINAEHIFPNKNVLTGIFAAYEMDGSLLQEFNFNPNYMHYLDEEGLFNQQRGYLDAIYNYHSLPVVISGFGYSSSRGISDLDDSAGFNRGRLQEFQQAQALQQTFDEIVKSGINGAVINYLYDDVSHNAWNVEKLVEPDRSAYWLNAENSESSLGLIALLPGESTPACIVDGKIDEWKDVPVLIDGPDSKLQITYDEKYLYFHIHIDSFDSENDLVVIPIDVTPNSGALKTQSMTFDRPVDFLLHITGEKQAQLMVQDYYNVFKASNKEEKLNNSGAYSIPSPNGSNFETVSRLLRKSITTNYSAPIDMQIDTPGALLYGNNDPDSDTYNSLADYYILGDDIEIRIPWMLLNFSDPSTMRILNDFYKSGDKSIAIDRIFVSMFVQKNGTARFFNSEEMPLDGWQDAPVYHMMEKRAFYTVKEVFGAYI